MREVHPLNSHFCHVLENYKMIIIGRMNSEMVIDMEKNPVPIRTVTVYEVVFTAG